MSQYDDYMSDLSLVQMGEKPIMIIERRKSAKAFILALQVCYAGGIFYNECELASSNGVKHPALVISLDAKPVNQVMRLIQDRAEFTREKFQIALGCLLGYTFDDCVEFVRSPLSVTCGCQLCGGPTPESRLDDAATAARMINRGGA